MDIYLESKVEGLLGEVSDDAGEVAAPEAGEALVGVGAHHAVPHPAVARAQATLLEQLALVLDQQLHSLYRSRARLGNCRRDAGQDKIFTVKGTISSLHYIISRLTERKNVDIRIQNVRM